MKNNTDHNLNWKTKVGQNLPEWMKINNYSEKELEKRFDKHIKEIKKENYVTVEDTFKKLDKTMNY